MTYLVKLADEIELDAVAADTSLVAAQLAHEEMHRQNRDALREYEYTDQGTSYFQRGGNKPYGNGVPASDNSLFVYELNGELATIVTFERTGEDDDSWG